MSVVQQRNDELVDILAPDFVGRLDSTYAWKSLASMLMTAPGTRGVWMMSAFDGDGDCLDFAGNGLTLSDNGDLEYDLDNLVPCVDLDGAGDYLNRGDQIEFDITGTETYVQAALQGLTIVAFVKPDAGMGAGAGIVSKFLDNTNNRSYLLSINGAGQYEVVISSAGTAASTFTINTGVVYTANVWTFLCMRFDPSASLRLRVDTAEYVNAVATPANIFSGNAPFYIGRRDTGAAQLDFDGKIGPVGLYATYWPDYLVNAVFQLSRRMFNV